MRIGIVGVNYKSSSLELREPLVSAFKTVFQEKTGVLLLTCHRIEFYFSTSCLVETQMEILSLLREKVMGSFAHALYSYFSQDCFYHLGKVVSGIDSAVFGESEIQRQVKLAYEKARIKRELPYDIHYLFQKGLKIGKEIRSRFLMEQKETPLPWLIEEILKKERGRLDDLRLLFVGNSTINRKIISFFQNRNIGTLTLCTRVKKGPFPKIKVEDWTALRQWNAYDVVICGTYHEGYVINAIGQAFRKTIFFDLGVPRNIDVRLGNNPNLTLYNIDEIGTFAQKKRNEKEIGVCKKGVEKAVARQIQLFEARKRAKKEYMVGVQGAI